MSIFASIQRKKWWWMSSLGVLVLGYFYLSPSSSGDKRVFFKVHKNDFVIAIDVTGELEAKESVEITGPSNLREFQIWEVKVEKLVDEGTIVAKGDFVASLDKSSLLDKLKNAEETLDQRQEELEQAKLDSISQMQKAHDVVENIKFSVEAKQLEMEISAFEPAAKKKQTEALYNQELRKLSQAKTDLQLQLSKNTSNIRRRTRRYNQQYSEVRRMKKSLESFTIYAPQEGMIIYKKNRGNKITEGSTLRVWDPTVATLPNLNKLISLVYVNEVDIRKVKKGQKVEVGVDAFPDKKLFGLVTRVSNIGQSLPNSDAKVFEVTIEINDKDDDLRPAMTSNNRLITKVIPQVIAIPLEALHTEQDSLLYVLKKSGLGVEKVRVKVGEENNNEIVITEGISEGDIISMSYVESEESDNN